MYPVFYTFLVQLGILVAKIDGTIRLMNGINEFQGRLEVYENGRWGTVCDNGWDNHKENVIVACRQLGFATGRYTSRYVRRAKDKNFLVDNLICNGQERRLGACQFDVRGNKNCAGRHDYEVNLLCDRPSSPVLPTTGDIRLMNGKDAFEGRVEIFRGNSWLSICQNGWGTTEARVACKQLGFNGGTSKFNAFYGKGYGMPWRVKLECDSTKDKLIDCEALAAICIPTNTIGVVCEAPVPFGSPCKLEEQCEGNSVCVASQGRQLCQCLHLTTMFWDSVLSTCKMKSRYNATCQAGLPDNCASKLVCKTHGNTSKCLCPVDMFWDDRQTKCEQKLGYNATCRPDILDSCENLLICNKHDNTSKCWCPQDMFWDDTRTKCEQKSRYSATCRAGIQDSCAATLVCNTHGNTSKCLCPADMFWDDRQTKCEQKSLYEEPCYVNMSDSCESNLVCKQYNSSVCRCYDEGRMFWDPATFACRTKKPYNDMCATSTECQSNLVCRVETGSNRCLCAEQGSTVWHYSAKRCFPVTQLQAVYIQLELEYNQAQTYCANEVNGSLATWDDFQMVFENCTDNMADIWLQTISETPNKNDTLCQLASTGDRYYNISCYERLYFVCIHERGSPDTIRCKDFPLGTLLSEHLTSPGTAVVLTIVIIALLLIGPAVTVFIYKRKRNKYNKTWNSNGLTAGDGLQAFLNNAYDTNEPFTENPYMEVGATNEPDYANISIKAETIENRNVKSNRDNENHYTEVVRSKSAGYIDMEGRLPLTSTNETCDGYTKCHLSTSNKATRDHYIQCNKTTSNGATRNNFIVCSGSEITPSVYNTFSDMKDLSTDHIMENPYDHIQSTTEDGYGVLHRSNELIVNETDDDISGQRNSSEFPL